MSGSQPWSLALPSTHIFLRLLLEVTNQDCLIGASESASEECPEVESFFERKPGINRGGHFWTSTSRMPCCSELRVRVCLKAAQKPSKRISELQISFIRQIILIRVVESFCALLVALLVLERAIEAVDDSEYDGCS